MLLASLFLEGLGAREVLIESNDLARQANGKIFVSLNGVHK